MNVLGTKEWEKWIRSTVVLSRALQFIRFCFVGGLGTIVDTGVLFLFANPKMLALNITLSKLCAAEMALINNFVWNEVWTFRQARQPNGLRGCARRLLLFNAICGVGIFIAVLLLHLFHTYLGWNLYLSNLLSVVIVTIWNFAMNTRHNWQMGQST